MYNSTELIDLFLDEFWAPQSFALSRLVTSWSVYSGAHCQGKDNMLNIITIMTQVQLACFESGNHLNSRRELTSHERNVGVLQTPGDPFRN